MDTFTMSSVKLCLMDSFSLDETQNSEIDDYDLIDKDPEEFRRRGMEAYGITDTQLSVVTPYEIHSILTVNI